jgi:8-oxo-dGTP pyrophosphatase MutT (NUDIX family)
MRVRGYEVVSDERVGQGGFLVLRRLRVRAVLEGGERTREGLYDYVERPMGLDAVVVAIFQRPVGGGARVLLRRSVRIPLAFGRSAAPEPAPFDEVVAGILERGEESWPAIQRRAADEALEEAGLRVAPERIERLGAASFPTPGMCPELFHLVCCEVTDTEASAATMPEGDGSPFEEGASLRWISLDDALAAADRGELPDMKTELILRRLAVRLRAAT